MKKSIILPVLQALLAAVLFGASAPLSKLLLDDIHPVALAGLLYLGSGLGALLLRSGRFLFTSRMSSKVHHEAPLKKGDLLWVAGAVIAGGILGPILLMVGINRTPAATAALLLNFESVATVLIAVVVFKEAISRRIWWALGLIILASMILSWSADGQWGISAGALAILGACMMWGIDNNLTRNVSAKDPLSIVMIKGLIAGGFSLGLSFILGQTLPSLEKVFLALLLGSLSYGLSISLFVLALRGLGAIRTGALFASAPFVGSILSLFIFHEGLTLQFALSMPIMLLGAGLLSFEKHDHSHEHEWLAHEHSHRHDDLHHQHDHLPEHSIIMAGQSHSHWHTHEPLSHSHDHKPDIHHWHDHRIESTS